jgi:hypothetical protein
MNDLEVPKLTLKMRRLVRRLIRRDPPWEPEWILRNIGCPWVTLEDVRAEWEIAMKELRDGSPSSVGKI